MNFRCQSVQTSINSFDLNWYLIEESRDTETRIVELDIITVEFLQQK